MKLLLGLLVLALSLSACNEKKSNTLKSLSDSSGGCSAEGVASSTDGPLFKLNGEVITRNDLPKNLKESVFQNEFEAYSKNQNIFKEYALRIHLAKKQNKLQDPNNPPPLMDLLQVPEPSEKELKALFDQFKSRMPKGSTFEQMKGQLAGYLKSQKAAGVFQQEVANLEKEGIYQSLIAGPVAPEMSLNLEGHPYQGVKNSKIQVVEVSDYTCGHCQRAHPEVKKMLEKYKGKINFTQMNFALRPSGLSGAYVRAAYCAQEQGMKQFWDFHHHAFEETSKPHDHNDPAHSHGPKSPQEQKETVSKVAKEVKLDIKKFETCFDAQKAKDYMMNTQKHLSEQGISGTPAFIVNNKKVMGGIAEVEKAIEELL